MSWDTQLAKEFRKRENPSIIGPCIGIISSVEPFAASILDGQISLDSSNSYICDSLLEHTRDFTRTGTDNASGTLTLDGTVSGSHTESGTMTISGSCSLGGNYPSGSPFESTGDTTITGTVSGSYTSESKGEGQGTITLKRIIKSGDMILVIPSGDEQKFFIVDIIKGVE